VGSSHDNSIATRNREVQPFDAMRDVLIEGLRAPVARMMDHRSHLAATAPERGV
jgi:hypothetical protein